MKSNGGGALEMPYDPDKHHRRSIRLKGYDYRQQGMYFVTVCVQGRVCHFGEVVEGQMCLSENGRRTQQVWLGLPERFAVVELDEWMIMPDHIHGILVLNDPLFQQHHATLGEIVRTYKAVTTQIVRSSGTPEFAWQRNYHERIIRIFNPRELNAIRQYIANNPSRWHEKHQRNAQTLPLPNDHNHL